MKILFVGDTHGNINAWIDLCRIAIKNEIDVIVQLGDFGYWEHEPGGKEYLDVLDEMLPCDLYFIDGNHDNHPLLWEKYCNPMTTFNVVREHIFYIPRGATWHWEGRNFLAMGGAYSIDKAWRIRTEKRTGHVSYWPEEMITPEQAEVAVRNSTIMGNIDIMLTHDAPQGAPIWKLTNIQLKPEIESIAAQNRRIIREIAESVKPRWLIHGHFHARHDYVLSIEKDSWINCYALDCDVDSGGSELSNSYLIWDI